jgi:hypothetical protein
MLAQVDGGRVNIIYWTKGLHSTYVIQSKDCISMFMSQDNLQLNQELNFNSQKMKISGQYKLQRT